MEYNFKQGLLTTPEGVAQALARQPVQMVQQAAPQPQPVDTTQMINQAVNHGMQQEQAQAVKQQMTQQMADDANTLNRAAEIMGIPEQTAQDLSKYAMNRYFQKGLLGKKYDYARAEAMGDEAGMQAAHQGAIALQDLARENGIDISGFGSDTNLMQAQARYDFNNFQHLNQMDEDIDSGTYYDRLYDQYKEKGMSDKGANYYAAQKAKEYQRNRIRQLKDELYANGFTNGAFNVYGERLIDMIHDESPEALTAIATRLPGYLQEYAYQIGERAKDNAYNRQLGVLSIQQDFQRDMFDRKAAANMDLARFNAANRAQYGGRSGTNTGSKTSSKNKGFDVAYNIMNVAKDIQDDPQWFIDHPEDHRLANAWNDLKKAFNDGLIDKKLFDSLKAVLSHTGGVVWGEDNYKNYNEEQAAIEARKAAEKAAKDELKEDY